jgi:hypothetical protein
MNISNIFVSLNKSAEEGATERNIGQGLFYCYSVGLSVAWSGLDLACNLRLHSHSNNIKSRDRNNCFMVKFSETLFKDLNCEAYIVK